MVSYFVLKMQQSTRAYFAAILVISIVTQVANAVEIIYLRKKTKTVFICLLLSLCLADLLTSLVWSVFAALYLSHIKLIKLFVTLMVSATVSSWLHIVAIAVDRCLSAFYPILHLVRMNTRKVKAMFILVIWSTSTAIALVVLKQLSSISVRENANVLMVFCGIFIIATGAALIGFYAMIIRKIFMLSKARRQLDANSTQGGTSRHAYTQEKATVIKCSVVTLTFFVCTYPYAIELTQQRFPPHMFKVVLILLNSLANPLAYFFADYTRRCRGNTN